MLSTFLTWALTGLPMAGPFEGFEAVSALSVQEPAAQETKTETSKVNRPLIRKIVAARKDYRERKAELARMRQLAKARNDQNLLQRIDRLEARNQRKLDTTLASLREEYGDEEFERAQQQIVQGEGRVRDRRRQRRTGDAGGEQPPPAEPPVVAGEESEPKNEPKVEERAGEAAEETTEEVAREAAEAAKERDRELDEARKEYEEELEKAEAEGDETKKRELQEKYEGKVRTIKEKFEKKAGKKKDETELPGRRVGPPAEKPEGGRKVGPPPGRGGGPPGGKGDEKDKSKNKGGG